MDFSRRSFFRGSLGGGLSGAPPVKFYYWINSSVRSSFKNISMRNSFKRSCFKDYSKVQNQPKLKYTLEKSAFQFWITCDSHLSHKRSFIRGASRRILQKKFLQRFLQKEFLQGFVREECLQGFPYEECLHRFPQKKFLCGFLQEEIHQGFPQEEFCQGSTKRSSYMDFFRKRSINVSFRLCPISDFYRRSSFWGSSSSPIPSMISP